MAICRNPTPLLPPLFRPGCVAQVGLLRGLETFSQLVRWMGGTMQYVIGPLPLLIHDSPRFPWRGLMVDTARHFLPVGHIFKTLDGMVRVCVRSFFVSFVCAGAESPGRWRSSGLVRVRAPAGWYSSMSTCLRACKALLPFQSANRSLRLSLQAALKLNVFHWHFSDAQSFSYKSDVFPRLSEFGAYAPGAAYSRSQVSGWCSRWCSRASTRVQSCLSGCVCLW
jgi:hypothetical protein